MALLLSQPERRLLKFALENFGERLTQFLLSGLGEEEQVQIWIFTVTFFDYEGMSRCRDLRVEADALPDIVTILPQRHEPLVMLALLRLLLSRQPFSSSLFYDQAEVLELLGWEDTSVSRLSIDEAVGHYMDISYQWPLGVEKQTEQWLSSHRSRARLITGCGYRDVEEGASGRMQRVGSRVDFAAEFINELMSRTLFGVDWSTVVSLERTSHP